MIRKLPCGTVECWYVPLDKAGYADKGRTYYGRGVFGQSVSVWRWQAYMANGDLLHGEVRCDRDKLPDVLHGSVAREVHEWRRKVYAQWEFGDSAPDAWFPDPRLYECVFALPPAHPLARRDCPRGYYAHV